jgi:hypothetical protein
MQLWWPSFAPIAALAVNVLAQIVIFRIQRGRHFFRAVVLAFVIGGLALLVTQCLYPPGLTRSEAWAKAILVNGPMYAGLSYCFFSFANLGQASIRIRIYARIAAARNGITLEEIAREYNEASLMEVRLQRLVESGDLVLRDGRYFLDRKRFVLIAHTIFWIKRLILGKLSEFD